METVCLHDKKKLECYLRKSIFINIYSIGDLDDYFWPYTTWYGLIDNNELKAVALVYTGVSVPTLIALDESKNTLFEKLLGSIIRVLPKSFYAHINVELVPILETHYKVVSHGTHYKMGLTNVSTINGVDVSQVAPLSKKNLDELMKFYKDNYPRHSFEPQMLDTNQYYGIRRANELISAAGVHVYSPQYKVAALANIVTHKHYRRKGYAKTVVSGLCKNLLRTVEHVGLNVKVDNEVALRLYRSLGFETFGTYLECSIKVV